jgi:uncharacterized protein
MYRWVLQSHVRIGGEIMQTSHTNIISMRLIGLLIACLVLAGCSSIFFHPHKRLYRDPAQIGLAFEDAYFPSTDGVTLHGWFLPAQGSAQGTVLFLHGNAENISTHIANVRWLPARGYNVFLPDYRGYGKSEGMPSLVGSIADIESALVYVLQHKSVDATRVVVFAQSLGGSMTTYAIAQSPHQKNIRALIIEGAFSSYRGIAQEKLSQFWLTWPIQYPLSYIVDDEYSPIKYINKINELPMLFIHGDADRVVPVHHGRLLHDAAIAPKELWIVNDGRHIDTMQKKENQDKLVEYLSRKLN